MRTLRVSPAMALGLALAAATAALGFRAFAAARPRPAPPEPALAALRPDLNSSPERHLLLLPGIGPTRARAIVEDRARNGPFASLGDLARVPGIGPGTAAALVSLARTARAAATEDPRVPR